MKKIIAALALATACLFAAQKASAIEDPNPKGTIVAGAQVGILPLGANVFCDYVLVDSWWKGHFTVGGMAGISSIASHGYGYTYFDLCPRATYGLNITDKFEVHVGALTGLEFNTFTYSDGTKDSSLHLCIGGITGCRYFFTEKLAASAEINYAGAFPVINAGIALKF